MPTLPQLIPDIETLMALSPEQVGRALLACANTSMQNGAFSPDSVTGDFALYGMGNSNPAVYPRTRSDEISVAVGEAWHWLELNMLIMPATGMNGRNGWKVFTRRGRALIENEPAFRAFVRASQFPQALLHPTLGNDVWLELAQGKYADAVFKSFRAVEERVRSAGNFNPEDIGVALMRRAFDPKTGPLTKLSDPMAEREALSALFAGAIGSYKNPHSHRTVALSDAVEAQEMVLLASHLLRIVDDRRSITNAVTP